LNEYKVQIRGGKGILTYRVTEKTGKVAGMKLVSEDDDVMMISSDGSINKDKSKRYKSSGKSDARSDSHENG